jgi:hypothetical protein
MTEINTVIETTLIWYDKKAPARNSKKIVCILYTYYSFCMDCVKTNLWEFKKNITKFLFISFEALSLS